MSRVQWMMSMAVIGMVFAPLSGFAAEHAGQEHGGATQAPAASTQEHAGEATTPASTPAESAPATTPAPSEAAPEAPPALKPISISFGGEVSEINTSTTPASITVQDRYGVKKQIEVPSDAKVTKGTVAGALADLKVGDKLTVEYTYEVATGKRMAKSINVGEGAAATPE